MPVATISQTGTGPTEVIAAVTGKRIRITGMCLTCNGDTLATLKDGAGSPVTLTSFYGTNGGGVAWKDPESQIVTGTGVNVTLTKSEGTNAVTGHISYETY